MGKLQLNQSVLFQFVMVKKEPYASLFEYDKNRNKHSVCVLLEIVSILILCGRQTTTMEVRTDRENTNAFLDCRTQLDIVL